MGKKFEVCSAEMVLEELDDGFHTNFLGEAEEAERELSDILYEMAGLSHYHDNAKLGDQIDEMVRELWQPELEEFARECLRYVADMMTFMD